MASFDQTVTIRVPAARVWQKLRTDAPQSSSRITAEKLRTLLVLVTSTSAHVYLIEALDKDQTRIRHVVTSDRTCGSSLKTVPDIGAAMNVLPGNISEEENAYARKRLQQFVHSLERSVSQPPARPESASKPAAPINEMPPFRPIFTLLLGAVLGYAGAGLLTALNWSRLGRPQRFWPVVLGSIILAPILLAIVSLWMGPAALWVGFIAGWIIAIALSEWQKPAYNTWVAQHEGYAPALAHSGSGTFLLIVALAIVVNLFFILMLPMLVAILSGGR